MAQIGSFTREQVARKDSRQSLWCIIDTSVYDLTDFADAHPGGEAVLLQIAGTDCTSDFYNLHRHEVIQKYSHLKVGSITNEKPSVLAHNPGDLSLMPYGEPTWLTPHLSSPYYKASHHALRKAMRKFVDAYITPEAAEKEKSGEFISDDLLKLMYDAGITQTRFGPGKHLHGVDILGGVVKGEEFDYFHDLIVVQEMARIGYRGFQDGNLGGMIIGLTAVVNWAPDEVWKNQIVKDCFSGKKKLALAISEAFAGSDVAGIRTTAKKTADGRHYIVNGTKKWITNGHFSDYFVTAVKTDKGISVLFIERGPGVETTPIKTSYSAAAGTANIFFDNVKVPVTNLLGQENKGFSVIMGNFNHERWTIIAGSIRMSRLVTEECLKWSNQRKVFGKRLIDQPVIRQKLAKMIAHCESTQAYIENITYQMNNLSYSEQNKHLAGPIALMKMFASRSAHEIADEAVQIFGGRGITQTGMGRLIEMFNRTYKFDSILGGTEEILGDLGVRQAMKFMPKSML
ncbi:hypothetical protein OIDMADRAFT_133513 [Oidiodendron maius Zn]|uniref:Cytochrome b5 heme-binding domain-containing protein n=1 Tax=Oidiodendron maius (strain Zn) TaxID=913774 RepID=A0A0C3GZN8_OIDMZ|nr:hypothetical protein OIDMADRAFT_133513 [Oidiodendron maius Zn]